MSENNKINILRPKVRFWEKTNTWRKEPDFWRLGIMKKMPVLLSLSIVMLTGIILAIFLK